MQIPSPNDPHIMGLRRPYLSRKNEGNREPIMNMVLMTPPRSRERFLDRPTLSCKTEAEKQEMLALHLIDRVCQ